jgi:hypothetical protein
MERYGDVNRKGSLGGIRAFAKGENIPYRRAKEILEGVKAYNLFRPARRRVTRRQILGTFINQLHVGDLAEVSQYPFYPRFNNGTRYLLVIVDSLSRICFVRALKDKKSTSVRDAMLDIYQHPQNRCDMLLTDEGTEFKGACLPFYEEYQINHYNTQSTEIKASQAERKILDIKRMLTRYLEAHNTHKYYDILPQIEKNLNSRDHRVIKMQPDRVNEENESEVFLNSLSKVKTKIRFKIGDHVRVSLVKKFGNKAHRGVWSSEIYKIERIDNKQSVVCYYLKDLNGEDLTGKFYNEELQKVAKPEYFEIEKILRSRNNKREYLVKFRDYPDSVWIPAADLKKI